MLPAKKLFAQRIPGEPAEDLVPLLPSITPEFLLDCRLGACATRVRRLGGTPGKNRGHSIDGFDLFTLQCLSSRMMSDSSHGAEFRAWALRFTLCLLPQLVHLTISFGRSLRWGSPLIGWRR